MCEGARLEQEWCRRGCAARPATHEWDPEDAVVPLHGAAAARGEVIAGDELEVESIEVEEAACTA